MPVQFGDWWEKYLCEGRGMSGVSVLSVWDCRVVIKEVAQCHSRPQAVFLSSLGQTRPIGQSLEDLGWADVALQTLHPNSPLGFSRAVYPTLSHHRSDSSPSLPHQSPGRLQLRNLTASSSASQQLPNNARPDNRLPCRLQVCQPWTCQITVSVNSQWGSEGK